MVPNSGLTASLILRFFFILARQIITSQYISLGVKDLWMLIVTMYKCCKNICTRWLQHWKQHCWCFVLGFCLITSLMLPWVYMNYMSNQDDKLSGGIVFLVSIKKVTLINAFYLIWLIQEYNDLISRWAVVCSFHQYCLLHTIYCFLINYQYLRLNPPANL